jgi:sarcosine oxidase subunit beta
MALSEHVASLQPIAWHEPRDSYDVVIVGGGGHGLATAYYLATRHGITNVAVVEADYIASGNTGRNTTIIRANYAIPEAIRFYARSLQLYEGFEAETGARSSIGGRAMSGSPTPRWGCGPSVAES